MPNMKCFQGMIASGYHEYVCCNGEGLKVGWVKAIWRLDWMGGFELVDWAPSGARHRVIPATRCN
jgi:hypothetical protein